MNIQENIRKILREEFNSAYLKRRYACFEDFVIRFENGEDMIPPVMSNMSWHHSQIIIVAYMRMHCGEEGNYDEKLHDIIMSVYGDRLYEIYAKIKTKS
jgi:hypothetical protein